MLRVSSSLRWELLADKEKQRRMSFTRKQISNLDISNEMKSMKELLEAANRKIEALESIHMQMTLMQ